MTRMQRLHRWKKGKNEENYNELKVHLWWKPLNSYVLLFSFKIMVNNEQYGFARVLKLFFFFFLFSLNGKNSQWTLWTLSWMNEMHANVAYSRRGKRNEKKYKHLIMYRNYGFSRSWRIKANKNRKCLKNFLLLIYLFRYFEGNLL